MANLYGPLSYADGEDTSTVIDPRFGTGAIPVQPAGWGGDGAGTVDTGEIWVDTDYTGATDASTDINAALQLAYQIGQTAGNFLSPTVRLKPGVLRLDSRIGVGRRSRLVGSGMRATRLRPVGNTHGIERDQVNFDSQPDDIWISDLEIDGAAQTGTGAAYKGITGAGGLRITLKNLWVHDTAATGIGWDSYGGVIENCWATGCGRNAKASSGQPGNSGFGIGIGSVNTYPSGYPANYQPLTVSNCHAYDNGNYGFFWETQNATGFPRGLSVVGCTSARNRLDGFGDDGGHGLRMIGCTAYDNDGAGFGLNWGTMGVDKGGKPGVHTAIIGCYSEGNAYGVRARTDGTTYDLIGLMVKDSHIIDSTVAGVLLSAAGTGTHRDLWLAGNHVEGSPVGVRVIGGATVDRLAVTGNRIKGMTGAAVSVEAPTTNVRVWGNEAWGNGSGIFFDTAGPHTNHRIDTSWVEGANTLPI